MQSPKILRKNILKNDVNAEIVDYVVTMRNSLKVTRVLVDRFLTGRFFLARTTLIFLLFFVMTHCGSLPLDDQKTFDRSQWMEDYDFLKSAIAATYVNLDDLVKNKKVDLANIDATTMNELRDAHSNDEAQHALFKFIGQFHDPYLELMSDALIYRQPVQKTLAPSVPQQVNISPTTETPVRPESAAKEWGGSTSSAVKGFNGHQAQIADEAVDVAPGLYSEEACTSMGFKKRTFAFHFPYQLSGRSENQYSSESFPAIIVNLEDGRRIGMIRIGRFSPKSYFDICVHEWPAYSKILKKSMPTAKKNGPLPRKGKVANGTCGPECQNYFIEEYVENRMIRDFSQTVEHLKKDRVIAILIDVTDNNGGTQWETALPHILTNKKIDCGGFGVSKNPATLENMRSQRFQYQAQIERLKKAPTNKKYKLGTNAEQYISDLDAQIAELDKDAGLMDITCERKGIWKDAAVATSCPLVVHSKLNSCRPNPVYKYNPGIYKGPLYILTNRNSAGAAAGFVARLKNSDAAILVGETTSGTGCMTRNKGITTSLPNSSLKLFTPDCARYMSDGTNEIEGLAPQIPLEMSNMGSANFFATLKMAVQSSLPATVKVKANPNDKSSSATQRSKKDTRSAEEKTKAYGLGNDSDHGGVANKVPWDKKDAAPVENADSKPTAPLESGGQPPSTTQPNR